MAQVHTLISADGLDKIEFSDAGHHQMAIRYYYKCNPKQGWTFNKGGWNWIGNARQLWRDLIAKGYRKA